jgi:hypothetical protein
MSEIALWFLMGSIFLLVVMLAELCRIGAEEQRKHDEDRPVPGGD